MNRNRKLIASLVGVVALTNTVMPVCAEPSDSYLIDSDVYMIDRDEAIKGIPSKTTLSEYKENLSQKEDNAVAYQIQPGDTLSSIAKANNTTVEELIRDTGIKDPNKIKAGDYLVSEKITEVYVLSKGQDPKQTEKQYYKSGVIKRSISDSEQEILRSLFNAQEYMKLYPDVAEACKPSLGDALTLEENLFYHFINNGIWESRQPSESFSAAAYASAYSDLRESFGDNIVAYYTHYYNTTVNGDENRTITTVQKAQDAGIKVTDFDGNTVAVDSAGNIVTGAEADKIAAEKKLAVQTENIYNPIPEIYVQWTFNFDEETEKEEDVKAPSSEEKEEPVAPVAPTKTYKEAYLEWLANAPEEGSSDDAYFKWQDKEPKLEDYADGRAFIALYKEWESKEPNYDAYLAQTNYDEKYAEWQAKEPKLSDYTILIGTQTAEEKYNEDYEAWKADAPKPEDYIKYTSFEADYNSWLANAPVADYGIYASEEDAMAEYNTAHDAWNANAPKESDYIDGKAYEEAVGAYNEENPEPTEEEYISQVIDDVKKTEYDNAFEAHEAIKPQESEYIDDAQETVEYKEALADHEADKPDINNYVGDIYADENEANQAFNSDHSDWEGEEPSKDSYIDCTTYADDLGTWEEKEPDFNEYFGIEKQNNPLS